jgi:hypothetical protein
MGPDVRRWQLTTAALVPAMLFMTATLAGQYPPGQQGSSNVHVAFHLPSFGSTDIRVEQELARPYLYQAHRRPAGFYIVNIKDPGRSAIAYSWQIENSELVQGTGSGVMLFKEKSRYYSILSVELGVNGPASDVAAIVFDVTSLPDTSRVTEVARIHNAKYPGGSHEAFTYKHSDGRPLFFTTVANGPFADIYDLRRILAGGAPGDWRIGQVPVPREVLQADVVGSTIYHDFFVGYDPATHQDKFYAGGRQLLGPGGGQQNGYYVVYDVTHPEDPKLLVTVHGVPGVTYAHTFIPSPDGRYAVAESEHQFQPLRIFDLKPALDGTVKVISRPIGAWTPNWRQLPHQMEMRWPYLFVAGYADGMHVVNVMDPTNPYTVGYYDTYDRPTLETPPPEVLNYGNVNSVYAGNWGVDIRNADGLIVASDSRTGIWGFKMDGFDGWNGHQWGMPNVSGAQDWDNGPDGAATRQHVSFLPDCPHSAEVDACRH